MYARPESENHLKKAEPPVVQQDSSVRLLEMLNSENGVQDLLNSLKKERMAGGTGYGGKSSTYRWSNYSIVPQLSVGNSSMILCDESTLCTELPDDHCFDNLTLIVNCHQADCDKNKYKVGTCSTPSPPKVLCNAVHTWHWNQNDIINKKCHEI